MAKLLRLGKKKEQVSLFCSRFFRNFGFAELTWHSEMKRKASFSFAFPSFFRNFARICRISLNKGSLGN